MQTFLAYPDFKKSAECLDPSRLGNQVYRECKSLINGGWKNHPIARMWHGYEHALAEYSLECLYELERRGRNYPLQIKFFKDCLNKFPDTGKPPWFGNDLLHSSHRSNLLRKNKDYYQQFGWSDPDTLLYAWYDPDENKWYNKTAEMRTRQYL